MLVSHPPHHLHQDDLKTDIFGPPCCPVPPGEIMEKSETLESQPGPAEMLHGKPLILVFWISQNKTDDLVEF